MTEYSGPFESSGSGLQESDWLELEDTVQPYAGYVANYGDELVVSQHTPLAAMSVDVATGAAIVKSSRYRNTAVKTVTIDAADSTQDRYDLIVVQRTLNPPASTIVVTVHKGTNYTAGSAVAPDPTRSSTVYELVLAQVFVAHATTAITTAMITDERLSANCGIYTPATGGLTIDATTGDFNFDGQKLIDVADPVSNTDAETKGHTATAIAAAVAGITPPGRLLGITKYTSGSGNHTLNANTTFVRVRAWGGCGGGGGSSDTYGGGGGGAGGAAEWLQISCSGGAACAYSIGVAGSGGATGNPSGTAGSAGGNTAITIGGTTYTVLGGAGGAGGSAGGAGAGGAGGNQTAGDIFYVGFSGSSGATGGGGGAGGRGLGNGAGGAGGSAIGSGGSGSAGTLVIEEYA